MREESKREKRPRKARPYQDITQEELEEIMSFEANLQAMLDSLDTTKKIFSMSSLKRFFAQTLAEINPRLSTTTITLQNYDRIFSKFILPRVCFAYWDIQNDQETYEHWPEALKVEQFLINAWRENYEDDLRSKFIYD